MPSPTSRIHVTFVLGVSDCSDRGRAVVTERGLGAGVALAGAGPAVGLVGSAAGSASACEPVCCPVTRSSEGRAASSSLSDRLGDAQAPESSSSGSGPHTTHRMSVNDA